MLDSCGSQCEVGEGCMIHGEPTGHLRIPYPDKMAQTVPGRQCSKGPKAQFDSLSSMVELNPFWPMKSKYPI